jgi:molybdopterin molybdotransferase
MIAVNEAKAIIEQSVSSLTPTVLPLAKAAGLVLAADVYAVTDIPNFRQSSMDGYAIKYSPDRSVFKLAGEMAAGAAAQLDVQADEAVRIFTGAPLPRGADTVVMQERVRVENGQITIDAEAVRAFQHVREKGAEVEADALAMRQGTLLTPAAIGFLAGIGISKVKVIPAPKVCVILTGNELQEPGRMLEFGQVYEANSVMLRAVLAQYGVTELTVRRAEDDLQALQLILNQALSEADLILLTGGVSVGDYDFVVAAAKNCGVKQAFHKIRQKPGKPLFFGTKYQKIVFGLPGNPSSVLSCFYQYVLPAVGKMLGKNLQLQRVDAVLAHDYPKALGLTHFLKGCINNGQVTALHAQESFRLHSFAQADCLIVLEESRADYRAGDHVEVHLIPGL